MSVATALGAQLLRTGERKGAGGALRATSAHRRIRSSMQSPATVAVAPNAALTGLPRNVPAPL